MGELVDIFAHQIPLHSATRKWLAGRKPDAAFASPDHMRFHCLTQYLHWLHCEFSPAGNKTRTTVVHPLIQHCPICHNAFVTEKSTTCSRACARVWARQRRWPA